MPESSSVVAHPREDTLPAQADLDRCVHCGLCLNACPTYRELGLEMDSPRGRIHLISGVANGAPVTGNYLQHIDLCLACRGCETACPSGVPYGRIIEDARAHARSHRKVAPLAQKAQQVLFGRLLHSHVFLQGLGAGLYLYQALGVQSLLRAFGVLNIFPKIGRLEALTPSIEPPFFFSKIGRTFAPEGSRRYRVAFLAGCIANVAFSRLNEATVRVLQRNGCEVILPEGQGCCGALHLHSGFDRPARSLARKNIDAVNPADYDAIITNAAGCGSTLKEYDHLLASDSNYADKATKFKSRIRDVCEFLASIDLDPKMDGSGIVATYQDSCHLAHGQKIKEAPRKLLRSIPNLQFREMPMADLCCGSAGIYNIVQGEMAMQILEKKMAYAAASGAPVIATANPGCMLQLSAGARLFGKGEKVMHVVELLDQAYQRYRKI